MKWWHARHVEIGRVGAEEDSGGRGGLKPARAKKGVKRKGAPDIIASMWARRCAPAGNVHACDVSLASGRPAAVWVPWHAWRRCDSRL